MVSVWDTIGSIAMTGYYITLIYFLINQRPLVSRIWNFTSDKVGYLVSNELRTKWDYWKAKYLGNSVIFEDNNGTSFVIQGGKNQVMKSLVRESLIEILKEDQNFRDLKIDEKNSSKLDSFFKKKKTNKTPRILYHIDDEKEEEEKSEKSQLHNETNIRENHF